MTALRRKAHRIADRLHDVYGSPDHGNKSDPLDELIYILLSQMTTGPSCQRVFDRLRRSSRDWLTVRRMPISRLRTLICDAGLSRQRSRHIHAILRRVEEEFGTMTLDPLRERTDSEVEEFLCSLPGIGIKSAKCVMMYSLGRPVLPVDTHVWRIARRVGLVSDGVGYDRVHEELEQVVAPRDRYSLHVNAIAHGRTTCLVQSPRCSRCPIRRSCLASVEAGGP